MQVTPEQLAICLILAKPAGLYGLVSLEPERQGNK